MIWKTTISISAVLLCAEIPTAYSASEITLTEQDIVQVESREHRSIVTVGGTVVAAKRVRLDAQTPGRVIFIAGEEGDHFSDGQALIRLDDSAIQARLNSARAQEAEARATIANAQIQLQREIASPSMYSQTPSGMGMPSMMDQMFFNPMQGMMGTRQPGLERHSDVVARRTELTRAQSQHLQIQSQIQELEASLRDTLSIAPFEGVIAEKHVESGDTVQPGQPLLTYSDTRHLQIQAEVPLRLRASIQEGISLPVRLRDEGQAVSAKVDRIFPVADFQHHTVTVKLNLPEGTKADAGAYAEISIPDRLALATQRLYIPRTSVVWKGGLPLVFIVNDAGIADLRLIRVGELLDAKTLVVLSGLSAGERIIARPRPGLRAGDSVLP